MFEIPAIHSDIGMSICCAVKWVRMNYKVSRKQIERASSLIVKVLMRNFSLVRCRAYGGFFSLLVLSTQKGPAVAGPFVNCVCGDQVMILDTTPDPTVRPPSRIAKRRPDSIAIGAISSTSNFRLSPGITISVPSGSVTVPVTSVVRK